MEFFDTVLQDVLVNSNKIFLQCDTSQASCRTSSGVDYCSSGTITPTLSAGTGQSQHLLKALPRQLAAPSAIRDCCSTGEQGVNPKALAHIQKQNPINQVSVHKRGREKMGKVLNYLWDAVTQILIETKNFQARYLYEQPSLQSKPLESHQCACELQRLLQNISPETDSTHTLQHLLPKGDVWKDVRETLPISVSNNCRVA